MHRRAGLRWVGMVHGFDEHNRHRSHHNGYENTNNRGTTLVPGLVHGLMLCLNAVQNSVWIIKLPPSSRTLLQITYFRFIFAIGIIFKR
jgi:hypothetical protein